MDEGLRILDEVRRQIGVPILTDVHEIEQIKPVADVVDVLQTPAFLCRQTDFIRAVAQSGKPVNIKKGQFLAPADMKNVIEKARSAAAEKGLPTHHFLACERGVSFGYNNLISDMRGLAIMRHGLSETIRRWCLMRRIRCNCRVVKAQPAAVNVNSYRFWRAPPSQPEFPVFSWKRIRTQAKRGRMVRMPYRSIA